MGGVNIAERVETAEAQMGVQERGEEGEFICVFLRKAGCFTIKNGWFNGLAWMSQFYQVAVDFVF